MLLCVGQFFPDSADQLDEFNDYIEGRAQIPLPTYFIGDYGVGGAKVLLAATRDAGNQGFKLDGLKICDNLYWLKGSGKFTLHGIVQCALNSGLFLSLTFLFGYCENKGGKSVVLFGYWEKGVNWRLKILVLNCA